jgi:hypothetical protein
MFVCCTKENENQKYKKKEMKEVVVFFLGEKENSVKRLTVKDCCNQKKVRTSQLSVHIFFIIGYAVFSPI